MKAQYQDNISDTSYLRAFGYIFYSNTNRSGAIEDGITGLNGSVNLGGTNYDYELGAHTSGGQLQYANQISSKHELVATLNYVESETLRYYNFNNFNTGTQQVSNLTNGGQCFAQADGTLANGQQIDNVTAGQVAPCNDPITQGDFEDPPGLGDPTNPMNLTCASTGQSNSGPSLRSERGLASHLHRQPGRDQLDQARTRQRLAERRMETQRKARRDRKPAFRQRRVPHHGGQHARQEFLVRGCAKRVLLRSGDVSAGPHPRAAARPAQRESLGRVQLPRWLLKGCRGRRCIRTGKAATSC